jgi:hypothetical protein
MPKTKFEELIFTLLTSGLMIFLMGVYNVALNTGGLQYSTFIYALHSFPLEWGIGFLCAFFIAGKISKHFAFQIIQPTDRIIFKILTIQTFTVCTMVPLMSLLGTIEASGITKNTLVLWLQTIILNFIIAYPLQIFVVGPLCRKIFRTLFSNKKTGVILENRMIQDGFAE